MDNYLEMIKLFMSGEMDIKTFSAYFKSDDGLRSAIDDLLPVEAIDNREHECWNWKKTGISFDVYREYGFSCSRLIKRICRFDNSPGDNLNFFYDIQCVFEYRYTDFKCTNLYDEIHDLYLDAINDCFEGPEVDHLVEAIINEFLDMRPKTARKKAAKEKVKEVFHVENNKRPRWIQGAEWPMGTNSPMKYLDRKTNGEEVLFRFVDVDTGEERIVSQFY